MSVGSPERPASDGSVNGDAEKKMDVEREDRSRSPSADRKNRKSKSRSASRSRSRSRSKSKSRSRSNSRSRNRKRSRSGSPPRRRSRSHTYSPVRTDSEGRRVISCRIHVSDFSSSCSKRELERSFEKYGKIVDVWMATYPPYYAFITYKHHEDAERAIRKMNEEYVGGNRIRVAHALPKRESFRPSYRGGSWGGGGPRRRFSPPRYNRRRSRSRSRSRDRRRSRSPRDRRRDRSRSGSR